MLLKEAVKKAAERAAKARKYMARQTKATGNVRSHRGRCHIEVLGSQSFDKEIPRFYVKTVRQTLLSQSAMWTAKVTSAEVFGDDKQVRAKVFF
jgi:hypothetical protein